MAVIVDLGGRGMLLGRNKFDDGQWVSLVVFVVMFLVMFLVVYRRVYRWVCRRVCRRLSLLVYLVGYEVLDVNEPVADHDKWRRSFALSKPVDDEPGLTDPNCKPGKVAVARYQAEDVKILSVQQIHGVDNHGGVRGILAVRIGKLLHRLDSLLEEVTLPPVQVGAGPVAIGPLYAYRPISGYLREQWTDPEMLCVVRINEDGELVRRERGITRHLVVVMTRCRDYCRELAGGTRGGRGRSCASGKGHINEILSPAGQHHSPASILFLTGCRRSSRTSSLLPMQAAGLIRCAI